MFAPIHALDSLLGWQGMRASACRTFTWITILVLLVSSASSVSAQTDPPAPPADAEKADASDSSPNTTKRAGVVREGEPILYYKDPKTGKLLPLLINVTPEQIDALKRGQLGERRLEPRYSIQQLAATGSVVGDVAELSLKVETLINADDGVRVPLRLARGVIRGTPKYVGEGRQYVHPAADGSGYEWWIRGKKGTRHELTVDVRVPLARTGGQTQLRMNLPRARSSSLKLEVDASPVVAQRGDAMEVATKNLGGGRSELTTEKLDSSFVLEWRKRRAVVQRNVALEAEGQLLIRLNSQAVITEAQLEVSSFGSEFQSFRVSLPPGAELVESENPGLSVAAVAGVPSKKLGRLVEVRRETRSADPMKVRIVTRTIHDAATKNAKLPLHGFQVFAGPRPAARQFGFVALHVEGDWELSWDDDRRRARRSADDLPEALRGETFAAGFEYFSQPFLLNLSVQQKAGRRSVDAEYVVAVDNDQLRLDARFDFRMRGRKAFFVEVDLPEWDLVEESIGPLSVVKSFQIRREGSRIVIPLTQGSLGDISIRLSARKPIADGAKEVSFGVPKPIADTVGSAVLEVVPADNVVLSPKADEIQELRRQIDAQPSFGGSPQTKALVYRCESPNARFVAGVQVRPQEIDVDVLSTVRVTQESSIVEQLFTYRVAYEVIDNIVWDVPSSLATNQVKLKIREREQWIPLVFSTEDGEGESTEGGESAAAPKRIRITLPQARIGTVELRAEYPVEMDRLIPNSSVPLPVSLLMPTQGELASNVLSLTSQSQIRLQCLGKEWDAMPSPTPGIPELTDVRYQSRIRTANAEIGIQLDRPQEQTWAVVERAWTQTWLHRSKRVDRVVLELSSNRDSITLILPGEIDSDRVELLLDGRRVTAATLSGQRLTVPLSGADVAASRTLEVRYELPLSESRFGHRELPLLEFEDQVWLRRNFLEVVLPGDRLLAGVPAGWLSENQLARRGFLWSPEAVRSQQQMESWAGASTEMESPDKVRRYLFSSFGGPRQVEVQTIGQSLIVLLASGITLVVGLLVLYASWARRAGALFVILLIAISLAMRYPVGSLVFGQAACLGLLLVAVAAILQRLLERPEIVPYTAPESSIYDRSTTEFFDAAGTAPPQGSTATASIAMELTGSHSKA